MVSACLPFVFLASVIFFSNLLKYAANFCCLSLIFSICVKNVFTGISFRKHHLKHGYTYTERIFKTHIFLFRYRIKTSLFFGCNFTFLWPNVVLSG